jgi:hypothetical protein
MTTTEFVQNFKKFSKTQQLAIIRKINLLVFSETYKAIDKELPDVDIDEEEVMKALKEVRYGRKKIKP